MAFKSGNSTENTLDDIKIILDEGSVAIPTSLIDGRKIVTTAGISVPLGTSSTIKQVTITAEIDNLGMIVVGGIGVIADLATREGIPLFSGDSRTIEIDDISKVYIDSTVNGEGVTYTYKV